MIDIELRIPSGVHDIQFNNKVLHTRQDIP
jgi:hypothetical protein